MKERIGCILLCILIWIVGCTFMCKCVPDKYEPKGPAYIDTLTVEVYDTIEIKTPVPDTVYFDRIIKVEVKNDEVKNDSTGQYIEIPIEKKEYLSDRYYAIVSGYMANLDTIAIFNKDEVKYIRTEKIIYRNRNQGKFGLGLQVGYGYSFGNARASPYIGLGLSYNFISW
ncbi:MAG: DUF6808 domain-containing protein [Bacteroidales bacterium]